MSTDHAHFKGREVDRLKIWEAATLVDEDATIIPFSTLLGDHKARVELCDGEWWYLVPGRPDAPVESRLAGIELALNDGYEIDVDALE